MNRYLEKGKEIISKYVDEGSLPGACFAYVDKDGYSYDHYGYKSLVEEKTPLTNNTLYDIASLSKVVSTSTMICKLMEEKLITFDSKVSDIIKEFPYQDTKIIDLIRHTSGLPADDKRYKECQNAKELWDFTLKLALHNPIGSKVEYSCFNYIILGKIIEHFKGNIEDYAKEVLFQPLKSDNIMYNPYLKGRANDCAPTEVTEKRGIIQGVVHDGKAFILDGLAGNAGVFSDIETLSRFVMMMLNDGVYDNKQVLKKESMDLFHHCYTEDLNEKRTMGGWFYGDKNTSAGPLVSDDCLYHTGFSGTSIYIDYERGFGLILLTNAIHPSRVHKMAEIRPLFHTEIIKLYEQNKGI